MFCLKEVSRSLPFLYKKRKKKKKQKLKNENLNMILKWLLWILSLKVQALGSDAPGYRWNDQLLK